MERIQEVALNLFDERGFARVSVEEIAATAEVSPSSVYRYFGTKEGIILSDDFDLLSDDQLGDLFNLRGVINSIRAVVSQFDASADDGNESGLLGKRRIRYFFEEPTVRRAAYETLAGASERIAQALAKGETLPAPEARILAAALTFAYFAALEEWYRNPNLPIAHTFEHALTTLGDL